MRRMDRYSRLVAIFKVLLPLTALAILATLFLISRGIDLDGSIPFAESEIAERTQGQQITGPFFSGTTGEGDEIVVSAALARPASQTRPAEATDVEARLSRADGSGLSLEAATASVDTAGDRAVFAGDVRIKTTDGLALRTDRLNTALEGVAGDAPGEITGTGPFGDFTAGRMEFGAQSGSNQMHMLFNDGVRLIYQPKPSD